MHHWLRGMDTPVYTRLLRVYNAQLGPQGANNDFRCRTRYVKRKTISHLLPPKKETVHTL